MFLSPLQESPSLWHFMTTRRGQKTTSASGKEKGSRLSTARKSTAAYQTACTWEECGVSYFIAVLKGMVLLGGEQTGR